MNILYIIDSLVGGGAEKLIHDLLPIVSVYHKCSVLLLSMENDKYASELITRGFTVEIIKPNNHCGRIKYITKYIRQNEIDIVHAHLFPVTYYCAVAQLILKKKNIKFVMTEHNTDNRRRHIAAFRPLEKFVYSRYHSVISISDETQKALINWVRPRNASKYITVPNGVPLKEFLDALPLPAEEMVSGFRNDSVLLCMVGSFTEQKNHHFMIQVMEQLPEKYHLLLVGEGTLYNKINELVSKTNLTDRVHFLGFRKDVAEIMKGSDIFVLPSKWEGFGLVAVEAMACGIPVVVTNVPGLSEVVGESGLQVELDDVNGFANAIMSMEEKEKYDMYVKKGLARSKEFDIERMVKSYLYIYSNLLLGDKQ